MRLLLICLTLIPLAGCSRNWEDTRPASEAGGTGILQSGEVAEGTGAVSSVSQLPAYGHHGAVQPFGSKGEAASYEFGTGYKVGAGDRLTVKVAGEPDLSSDYLVDGAGTISMPYVQTITIAGLTTSEIEDMIAGRLRWLEPGAKPLGKIAQATLVFPDGTLALTEAGTKHRAAGTPEEQHRNQQNCHRNRDPQERLRDQRRYLQGPGHVWGTDAPGIRF